MKLEMADVKSEDSASCDEIDDNSTTQSSFGPSVSKQYAFCLYNTTYK